MIKGLLSESRSGRLHRGCQRLGPRNRATTSPPSFMTRSAPK
jgi:hypothetical protein